MTLIHYLLSIYDPLISLILFKMAASLFCFVFKYFTQARRLSQGQANWQWECKIILNLHERKLERDHMNYLSYLIKLKDVLEFLLKIPIEKHIFFPWISISFISTKVFILSSLWNRITLLKLINKSKLHILISKIYLR